jgi:hypothetical protein
MIAKDRRQRVQEAKTKLVLNLFQQTKNQEVRSEKVNHDNVSYNFWSGSRVNSSASS